MKLSELPRVVLQVILQFLNTLSVSLGTSLSGTLDVNNAATTDLESALTVTGITQLLGALDVTGKTSLSGTLDVNNASTTEGGITYFTGYLVHAT